MIRPRISRYFLAASFAASVSCFAGCKQKATDDEAIRTAVKQYLTSLGTLNMSAFDTDFNRVFIQNDHATADVSFRPKTGAPAGAAMQVSYQLEKVDGNWRVIKKSTAGGMIQHPDPNSNPHGQPPPGEVHGKLPNFQEMLGNTQSSSPQQQPAPPNPHATQP